MKRRFWPAIGLFFLSPLVAEFLLGNLPITALFAVIGLAPLYGGGAVLIREFVRRRGWGYPSILVLALAYGVLEEGVTTQSLFNPNYADLRLLDPGHIGFLGHRSAVDVVRAHAAHGLEHHRADRAGGGGLRSGRANRGSARSGSG